MRITCFLCSATESVSRRVLSVFFGGDSALSLMSASSLSFVCVPLMNTFVSHGVIVILASAVLYILHLMHYYNHLPADGRVLYCAAVGVCNVASNIGVLTNIV
jgi:hypothetical protein